MYRFDPIAALCNEHNMLTSNFALHQASLVNHAWGRASRLFEQYKKQLERHIQLEEHYLIPHYDALKTHDQWPVRVYAAEHRRIERLTGELSEVFVEMPPDGMKPSHLIAILDAEKTLKNVLDHHHRREELAMFDALRHGIPERVRTELIEAMLHPDNDVCRLDG